MKQIISGKIAIILAAQDYVHKMVLYLMDGEKFIGGMSFLRNKQETPFLYSDKLLVSYLGHYISQLLTEQSQISELRSENAQLLEFADLSGDGLIVAAGADKFTGGPDLRRAVSGMQDSWHQSYELLRTGMLRYPY